MPRAALSRDAVVDLAVRLVDDEGPAALTLSAVAARAGVATPSLYKHVRNLAELRELLSARILGEMGELVGQAVLGRSGDEAVRALMHAWRAYVIKHPGRYAALDQRPLPSTAEVADRLLGVLMAALRSYGLTGSAAVHAARCLRAAAHGFAVLETAGGFGLPENLDASYDLLITMTIGGLRDQ
ncbi:TetR/AcrR family transcriptional regulator [Spongiactinospora sp. TRM90649]|uniref:TetR/AcrR family transcriptional regulator n=1 Tax=Spongiactinospora sp. TRM90649 TaxID=3031114 RepID=UPI0023F6C653|nr:TetR/AcrR family transcriptional regulator [Spongiactinospora sp. TRM90649]MDF5755294.1 WHG domain-containing protein [Spongiactinospora sp. TRM90649]